MPSEKQRAVRLEGWRTFQLGKRRPVTFQFPEGHCGVVPRTDLRPSQLPSQLRSQPPSQLHSQLASTVAWRVVGRGEKSLGRGGAAAADVREAEPPKKKK